MDPKEAPIFLLVDTRVDDNAKGHDTLRSMVARKAFLFDVVFQKPFSSVLSLNLLSDDTRSEIIRDAEKLAVEVRLRKVEK